MYFSQSLDFFFSESIDCALSQALPNIITTSQHRISKNFISSVFDATGSRISRTLSVVFIENLEFKGYSVSLVMTTAHIFS